MSKETVLRGLAPALVICLIVVCADAAKGPASAQHLDPRDAAIDRCEQELAYLIGQQATGNRPDATIDYGSTTVRQVSSTQVNVKGNGQFFRDSFDRGRPYSFDCTVNPRTGRTRVTYRWSGESSGIADDTGYRPAPSYRSLPGGGAASGAGSGRGGYAPSGRVFFSGGILNRGSAKGLDVENEGTGDRANVQQWDFGDKPNQSWDIVDLGRGEFSIINQGSNKVLDVASINAQDGTNVQQFRWHNGDNQRWRLERVGGGYYQIVSVSTGRCLDVEGKRRENGANIQVWSCSGQPNQHWRLGR